MQFHPTLAVQILSTTGSKRSSKLHKMYQSRCTTKNSWWWAERLPETFRVVIPIKLEFITSVGFIFLLLFLLLQSALQPLWVMACSTVVEYSQQEGFYRVPLPATRQNPQLGGPVIRTVQLPPQDVPHLTRANASSGRWNYGKEIAENFAESGDFHVTFGFFYMP